MNWKHVVNAALTAAISGGATAISVQAATTTDLKGLGAAFAGGALAGLVNWLRQAPAAKG